MHAVRLAVVVPLALLSIFAGPKRPTATGRVVDALGHPIVGATACLVIAGAPGLCDETAADGSYALPAGDVPGVRIVARGYMPRTVGAVAQESPIVLERAASVRVRIVNRADGSAVGEGEVDLVYSTGRTLGPFPINLAGVSLPTVPAGDARVVARCAGFDKSSSDTTSLVAGKESIVEIRVDPKK